MTGCPMAAQRDVDSEAGFTLVELLVALALFSLLAMLLFDNVRFGLQAWQHGSAHAENTEHSMISQDLLRRMIGNIYPMLVADGGIQPRIDFDGTKEAISFLGNAPISAGGGGRFRLKVFVERQQSRTDLLMSARPELANPQDSSMTTRTVLLSDLDRAEFSYFCDAAAERSAKWQDSWTRRSDIPSLVRIRVAFRSGDARSWPELLVAPRIATDVSCIYDPMTKRCRGR
jgi:general secretion pathway protein J